MTQVEPMSETRYVEHFIAGAFDGDGDERSASVSDPATGAEIARVALASRATVDRAVAAAVSAQQAWAAVPPVARARVLADTLRLLRERRDEIVEAIVSEHGKVRDDAMGELQRGFEVLEFACGMPQLLKGEYTDAVSSSVDSWSYPQPLGVVAGITPFNFPVMVPMWMHPIAIGCGNAFVLKPSEVTPSASNLVAAAYAEAGLPAGVFSVVHGDRVAVQALIEHPDVRAISFVGSTAVAHEIYRRAADAGKRVQALGGAKNHAVVLPDADPGLAADAIVSAAYGSAGERCMAISAVVAVGAAADPLVAELRERALRINTGPGHTAHAEMGPLVTRTHRDRVLGYVDAGVADGARLVVDGRGFTVDGCGDGFWLAPTLFDHVPTTSRIYTDEIFGPVLVVVRVDSFDDALAILRANPYANGAALFTNDGGAARRFHREVDAGMVGINVPIPVPMAFHSFGGAKQSLFGDTHMHGPEGVRFYTRTKVVSSRWPTAGQSRVQLGFPT